MIDPAKIDKAELARRKLQERYRYLLTRAEAIDNGTTRIEQRFGIVMDAAYYRNRAELLRDALIEMGVDPDSLRAA